MARFQDQVTDEHLHPVPGCEIWVFYASGPDLKQQARLTDDDGVALTQPLLSDEDGIFFYNTTDGLYENHVHYGGELRYIQQAELGAIPPPVPGDGSGGIFKPEAFGAFPNDSSFDNANALAAMSAALNAADGGTVELMPDAIYWIGSQTMHNPGLYGGVYRFAPAQMYPIEIANCAKPVVVNCNGAIFRTRAGLKFGTFNLDGTPMSPPMPNYYGDGVGVPYSFLFYIHGNSGGVAIKGPVELDGNIGAQVIGGQWGDTGYQIGMTGIETSANTCPVIMDKVHSHHHGSDGGGSDWAGTTESSPLYPIIQRDCNFHDNGRQGWSWVGGRGFFAQNCQFLRSGKNGTLYSAPGAGFDAEAESAIVRDGLFDNCVFSDNAGVGFLFVGDVQRVFFTNSKLIGTTSWSAWVSAVNPYVRFFNCQITGAINGACGHADPGKATQFVNCNFLFGTARSPIGVVYNGGYATGTGYMYNGGGTGMLNVLFDNCMFDDEGNPHNFPWTASSDGFYRNCRFKNTECVAGSRTSYTAGKFFGINEFDLGGANVNDFQASEFFGPQITYKGATLPNVPMKVPAGILVTKGTIAINRADGNNAIMELHSTVNYAGISFFTFGAGTQDGSIVATGSQIYYEANFHTFLDKTAAITLMELGRGGVTLAEVSAASVNAPPGQQTIFIDSADHKLKRKDNAGTVTVLA